MKQLIAAVLLSVALLLGGTGCTNGLSGSEADVTDAPLSRPGEPAEELDPAPDAENSEPEESVDEEADEESGSFKLGTEMVPESDERLIDRNDLEDLDNWGLTLARNEIFARHGRTFENEHLRDYFVGQPWYTPDPGYEREWLSATEEANVKFILEYQQIKYDIPAHQPRQ